MQITHLCVIGGSGFVGNHLCRQLAAQGYRVRVPTRDRERAKSLILLPTVDVVVADVHDAATLATLVKDCDVVINLVGVLHDGRGSRGFAAAHVELARKIVAACKAANVRRLLHMSALAAATDAPSKYLRSKGEAERIVLDSALDVTIFRPSVIFGPEDDFLNLFASLLRLFPLLPLGSPKARFQPVHVGDVAAAFVHALTDGGTCGHSYDLCGPRRYTLRELVAWVGKTIGCTRPVIGLNPALSWLQAAVFELSPKKILTRDNVRSMQVDSICDCTFPFGIQPQSLEAMAPDWLAARTPRARYRHFRDTAGR